MFWIWYVPYRNFSATPQRCAQHVLHVLRFPDLTFSSTWLVELLLWLDKPRLNPMTWFGKRHGQFFCFFYVSIVISSNPFFPLPVNAWYFLSIKHSFFHSLGSESFFRRCHLHECFNLIQLFLQDIIFTTLPTFPQKSNGVTRRLFSKFDRFLDWILCDRLDFGSDTQLTIDLFSRRISFYGDR